jgi:hypothetical protein
VGGVVPDAPLADRFEQDPLAPPDLYDLYFRRKDSANRRYTDWSAPICATIGGLVSRYIRNEY